MRQWLKEAAMRAARQIAAEGKQMGAHGSHELAAALFNGQGYVMYPRGHHEDPQQAHVEHGRQM